MKKILCLALVLVFSLSLISCGTNTNQSTDDADNGKISVVSTIFAPYDFACKIAGDKANVSMLLDPGTESHNYDPTPQDIVSIQDADVFIYIGGDSDSWVKDVLDSIDTSNVNVVSLMDCVEVVEEEAKEGMQLEHEEEEEEEEEHEYDEHVWTSPKNAVKIVDKICNAMCESDNADTETFKKNAESYNKQLDELDAKFEDVVSTAKRKTMIFGDRFPLRYFVDAYSLDYYGAFPGCSSDTEASASTIAFLINKVNDEKIPVVFTIELSNGKIADTICESTSAKKIQWNTCHNVTADQFKDGVTYLQLMEENVLSLKEALN